MRKIEKWKEPNEWIEYCRTPGVEFEGIAPLRKSLLLEQGYICAYCMQRISENKSKIEHIYPQAICKASGQEKRIFDYNNLVVCCEGTTKGERHCDNSKGDQEITFDIFSDNFINTLSYSTKTGELRCSNQAYQKEINDCLNLNFPLLKRMRMETLYGVINKLGKQEWKKSEIKRIRDSWNSKDANGMFKPLNGIVVWYLNKKLKR